MKRGVREKLLLSFLLRGTDTPVGLYNAKEQKMNSYSSF
jgi:hypothetical protein